MILYVSPVNIDELHTGVAKKIIAQCKALSTVDNEVYIIYPSEFGVGIYNSNLSTNNIVSKDKNTINFYYIVAGFLKKNDKKIKLIYSRLPYPGKIAVSYPYFLNVIRKQNNQLIVEIPTYPFLNESANIKSKLINLYTILWSFIFNKNIKYYFYMGSLRQKIWGVSAIRIFNAVDNDLIEFSKRCSNERKKITFIAVAQLAKWHGYDRLISGISKYVRLSGENDICFRIIGDDLPGSGESKRLERLIENLGVQEYVILLGKKSGEELTAEFKNADIAVDSLGRHRSGNNYNCSLKSKEYSYRGLPFIKSHMDDSFKDVSFVFECSSDDTDIDINEVLAWFYNLDITSENINYYAKQNFTWEKQLLSRLKTLGIL